MDAPQLTCPFCRRAVPLSGPDVKFCPYCGKTLQLSTSVMKQIGIYAVGLFLPPLGFVYSWKYLRAHDKKAKYIGITVTILTIISIVASVWLWNVSMSLLNQSVQSSLGGFSIY